MAVDGLDESESQVYQPCLPHLFDMLSSKKINNTKLDQSDMRNRPWDHKYFQVSDYGIWILIQLSPMSGRNWFGCTLLRRIWALILGYILISYLLTCITK